MCDLKSNLGSLLPLPRRRLCFLCGLLVCLSGKLLARFSWYLVGRCSMIADPWRRSALSECHSSLAQFRSLWQGASTNLARGNTQWRTIFTHDSSTGFTLKISAMHLTYLHQSHPNKLNISLQSSNILDKAYGLFASNFSVICSITLYVFFQIYLINEQIKNKLQSCVYMIILCITYCCQSQCPKVEVY